MPNSLDALCRRFSINHSARTTHNALLDCELLARVYVELTGGRQRGLSVDDTHDRRKWSDTAVYVSTQLGAPGADNRDKLFAGLLEDPQPRVLVGAPPRPSDGSFCFRCDSQLWVLEIGKAGWRCCGCDELAPAIANNRPGPPRNPRPSVPTEAELGAHATFLAQIEDPGKAALAEDERARAEAIKSRTEPLRLAAQAAEAAWRTSRTPPKIDRGQATGEVADHGTNQHVRSQDIQPSTFSDLGVSRQRVAECRDAGQDIAAAAPVITLFRRAMQRFGDDPDRADQWMRSDNPAFCGRHPEHVCSEAGGMERCLAVLAKTKSR